VAVAVAREGAVGVTVGVVRGAVVGVAVAPEQAPSLRHQLSVEGSHGAGGQSRVLEIAPMAVYLVLLKTTEVPTA
jgi:hypothetical protein